MSVTATDSDLQLLAGYTRDRAEDAFAELVRRHIDLVHSAALRQVRSPQLAEEVAQSVFVDLARNAVKLSSGTGVPPVLTAWLYQVTRRTAIDVVRREARRQLREQIATEMNAINETAYFAKCANACEWTNIEPLLDEAMSALDDTDRAAVLLRYFENKSLREVGATLGTTDDAAQKRVSRAVERLREFFAKRGVAVGARGLALVISANAVQAAPVGLAITISTAAVLAGTTVAAVATATTTTKVIAMSTLQKTIFGTTLAAAVGTGIYEARQASRLRDQVQTLQQQQAPLTEQIERLQQERDGATARLAALEEENERLNRNTPELLRLRGEVARLGRAAEELAQLQAGKSSDPVVSEALSWKNRVELLRRRLEQTPGSRIPELQFLTEDDWLNASRRELHTEADYRRALSSLRSAGEGKFAELLQEALQRYMKANNAQSPTDIVQLRPYFEPPIDDATLERWEVAPAETVKNLGLGGDIIITQKAPVDEVFDTRHGIGPYGRGSTDFLSRAIAETMNPVFESFKASHNGQWHDDVAELLPYAKTPEQVAALQKLMLRTSATD